MTPAGLVEVRIPASLATHLLAGVRAPATHEPAVFALASHATTGDRTLLLVRKLIPLPDSAYVPTRDHGARWMGRAMLPIINEALEERLGILLFHAHDHAGPVLLSGDDRGSAERLLATFDNLVPDRPHGSIVLGRDSSTGLVAMPGRPGCLREARVRLLGKVLHDLAGQGVPVPRGDNDTHDRQMLLIGSEGQRRLSTIVVGVVGLSGGGSHVVQQLAHLRVGEIVGVDHDRAASSNRSRVVGMTALDAWLRARKTRVMARLVRRVNRCVRFTGVPYRLPQQRAMNALKRCDIVVGCVDNYHARADLQELAWRYLIPYVDIGALIRPAKTGITIGGNVGTFVPGSFCQWCIGFLSQAKLDAETGGRPRSYFEASDKEAQVVSFNGLLASQAVSEVLQLITGFAPTDDDLVVKKFDGLQGTLTEWSVKKRLGCEGCCTVLAAGDPVWRQS